MLKSAVPIAATHAQTEVKNETEAQKIRDQETNLDTCDVCKLQ